MAKSLFWTNPHRLSKIQWLILMFSKKNGNKNWRWISRFHTTPKYTIQIYTLHTYIIIYIYILYSVNLSSFYPSIFPGCSHNSLFKLLPFFSVPPVQPILHNAHHQLRPCGRRQELGGNFEGAGGGVLWLRAQRRCAGSPRLIHLG